MVQEDYATIEMPKPTKEQMMEVGDYSGYFLTVGVPHFVVFLTSKEILESLDLATEGSYIRNHPSFLEGTNVDFVTILPDDSLRIRTYERGVEGETKACGSGSTASGVVFVSQFQPSLQTVHVITNGGLLTVNFKLNKIYCSGGVQDV
jgi:diaminopimelate epimerase